MLCKLEEFEKRVCGGSHISKSQVNWFYQIIVKSESGVALEFCEISDRAVG